MNNTNIFTRLLKYARHCMPQTFYAGPTSCTKKYKCDAYTSQGETFAIFRRMQIVNTFLYEYFKNSSLKMVIKFNSYHDSRQLKREKAFCSVSQRTMSTQFLPHWNSKSSERRDGHSTEGTPRRNSLKIFEQHNSCQKGEAQSAASRSSLSAHRR